MLNSIIASRPVSFIQGKTADYKNIAINPQAISTIKENKKDLYIKTIDGEEILLPNTNGLQNALETIVDITADPYDHKQSQIKQNLDTMA